MPHHASPEPKPRPRLWWPALIGAAALAPALVASGLDSPLTGAATAGAPATRIWEVAASGGLLFPIEPTPMCEFFNNFGGYSKVNGGSGHQGVDIGAEEGQDVFAVEPGVISEVDLDPAGPAGLSVRFVSDTDVQYRYYHLASITGGLAVGDRVSAGDVIGGVGDTGNATDGGHHLHFEVRPGTPYRTPVDPAPLLAIPEVCHIYGTVG